MLYRIYIPALDPDGVSMTIDVEAHNWMMALRAGLDEIGADRDIVKRAICDIKADKTIHVMEPAQGRIFVLREVGGDGLPAPAPEDTPPPAVIPAAQPADLPAPSPIGTARPHVLAAPNITGEVPRWAQDGASRSAPNDEPRWAQSPASGPSERPTAPQMAAAVDPERTPTVPVSEESRGVREVDERAARNRDIVTSAPSLDELDYPLQEADLEKYFDTSRPVRARREISHLDIGSVLQGDPRVMARTPSERFPAQLGAQLRATELASEELFAQVFEEMAEIEFAGDTLEAGLQFALELAVKRIPSEAGWLLLADMNRRDLYFATATGPKAERVIDYRLPMGKGIAGFCAVNGVSLSLSDVEKDPRFQSSISRSVGYKINSVACAPVQKDGRVFGAMQIMNHRERSEYTPSELDVLNYIARRTAEFLAANVQ